MKLFIKKLAFYLIPLMLLFGLIMITDPYKIFYEYEDYSYKHFTVNRHYVSTQYFLDNYRENKYDAFIFGNSRTLAFQTKDWKGHLPFPAEPYHFDASGESVYGMMKKVALADSLSEQLDQAIIVLDRLIFLEPDERDHPLFQLHPALNGASWVKFYQKFVLSIFERNFIPYYSDYITDGLITKILGKIPKEVVYTPVSNDVIMTTWEEELTTDEDAFFAKYAAYFIKRPETETTSEVIITEKHKRYLTRIKNILQSRHVNYKVIIGPDYRQVKFNPTDLAFLTKLFGAKNLYDFSGKNEFTTDVRNFYDGSHYRPSVARDILKQVYENGIQVVELKNYTGKIEE
ncbi:hypothetical protein [Tunicatimonas pelagia]|uniref:hypothetical protein n=1 Tax=Tunicatimonas pelagia TaxID=931531 RepID=UPI002664FD78|nr:hypothetical protein [Tunicatimonas pelagia]WKN42334.1 hypothetical protein P0M28_25185 [Tunicatimonas pelagia]